MTMHHAGLADIVRRDPRFTYEAYEFVFEALRFTQRLLDRNPSEDAGDDPEPHHHISGRELLEGIRQLAVREFGLMARTVFRLWGINRTDDFGAIVFNLLEAKLMSKTDQDSLDDFHNVYDLDTVLVQGFQIPLEEVE
jgi:uncharacterized repeat protein (TIGR04138 family)